MKTNLYLILTCAIFAKDIDFNALSQMHNSEKKTVQYQAKEYDKSKSKKMLTNIKQPNSVIASKIGAFADNMVKEMRENSGNFVMIKFDTTCGLLATCTDHKLNITGGPGTYSAGAGGSGAIHKGYNGEIAGVYHYVGSFKRSGSWRSCSGNFKLSGLKQNYTISVYEDCRDASSMEY